MIRAIVYFCVFMLLPVTGFSMQQVNYIGEMPVNKPLAVTIDGDNNIYVSQKTGSVSIMNAAGETVMTLGGKDKKWKKILKKPFGIAVYGGKIYVADAGLNHIAVFDKDGAYVTAYGTKGSKSRQFKNPQDICVYRGVFYVADTGNNRIQVFGPNFVFLTEIGTAGEKEFKLNKPLDVAVDYRGYIYVTDGKDKSLKVFSQEGTYLKTIDGIGEAGALAIDGGIYASDLLKTNITKFGYDYKPVISFGAKGNGRAQFGSIAGIASDSDGKIYITDPERNLIQIFHPERDESMSGMERVPPPLAVKWLENIAIDEKQKLSRIVWNGKDTLYAIDAKKRTVHAVKKDGTITDITVPSGCKPVSVALDSEKNLWVLCEKKLFKFKQDKEVDFSCADGALSKPSDIAISNDGAVYIADPGKKWIQVFNVDGIFIRVIGGEKTGDLFKRPVAVDVDEEGTLYVLDDKKKSVLVLSPAGLLIKEYGKKDSETPFFKSPVDIAVTGGSIHVLDTGAGNIKMLSMSNELISEYCSNGSNNGELKTPAAIAVIDSINLLVSDTGNNRIQHLVIMDTPAVPANVTARGGTRSVNIYWDKAAESFVEKYNIYKSSDDKGAFTFFAETDVSSYVDKDVEPGNTYFYKITAIAKEGNESLRSEAVSAVPSKRIALPPADLNAAPQENAIHLTWHGSKDNHVEHYVIYREVDGTLKEIGRTAELSFTDDNLENDTPYVYTISAVNTDKVESEKISIETRTAQPSRPPLEIEVVELHDIFSNTYKAYEKDGIGRIKITNNTKKLIYKLRVLFQIKQYMDFPSEIEVDKLAAGESKEIPIKAVFNNKLLDITEDTPVQSAITVHYYLNQDRKTFSKNHAVNIYEKHKMTWDDRERVAAFVTTKDPVLLEFTRDIVTQYSDTSEPLLYAGVLFNALGAMGITYMKDPTNSYQVTSDQTDTVDYLQYPRETLRRKSGDCDDLVILYSAALESLAITTKFIEVPGHLFMMFSIGTVEEIGSDTMDGLFAIDGDRVWVPVEVTMVGKSFINAWETGSKQYYEWAGKDLNTMSLHDAWATYKPASLPASEWRPAVITRDIIEKEFNNEFSDIRKINIKIWKKRYFKTLQERPDDVNALLQLGIAYAEENETKEAMKLFDKAVQVDPDNAALVNNIGNVHFLDGRFKEAGEAYEKSLAIDGNDYLVWINLAKAYLRMNKTEEAKNAFSKACEIEPGASKEFRSMSLKLLGPM